VKLGFEGTKLLPDLNEPSLSGGMKNFFSAVVAPTCEILPIILADAGNLL
jgi:hypothetical protein